MENNLKQELKLLRKELGTPAFDEHLNRMEGMYTSEEEKKMITECVTMMLDDIGSELKEVRHEVDVLKALKGISDMISFKYIAETYFKKSKAWFSQRMNGNTVHGKVCRFSEDELATLRFALQDISKKIGSLSI